MEIGSNRVKSILDSYSIEWIAGNVEFTCNECLEVLGRLNYLALCFQVLGFNKVEIDKLG